MTFFYYIRYFIYIAWNWNIRLAAFSVYHEILGERKYHIDTLRLDDLKSLTVTGDYLQHAEIYQGASYYLLENIFIKLKELHAKDGFLDIGCGKGRTMVVASHFGFKNITGIDFAIELCREARQNCEQITQHFPSTYWNVIHNNAADFIPASNIHVILFFNPFNHVIMNKAMGNIVKSLKNKPRKVWIVYINPQHKTTITQNGFKEVYYIKKMPFVEAAIFENG